MENRVTNRMRSRMIERASPEVRTMVDVGRHRGWPFRAMGRAPIPAAPVFIGDWWLVPVQQDTSAMPSRALERVAALYEAGVRPKGFVIAHEAPRLLGAPPVKRGPRRPLITWSQVRRLVSTRVMAALGGLAGLVAFGPVVLKALVTILAGIAAALVIPVVLIAGLGAVALVDPVLVAVTEDDYWVEIDRWYA